MTLPSFRLSMPRDQHRLDHRWKRHDLHHIVSSRKRFPLKLMAWRGGFQKIGISPFGRWKCKDGRKYREQNVWMGKTFFTLKRQRAKERPLVGCIRRERQTEGITRPPANQCTQLFQGLQRKGNGLTAHMNGNRLTKRMHVILVLRAGIKL